MLDPLNHIYCCDIQYLFIKARIGCYILDERQKNVLATVTCRFYSNMLLICLVIIEPWYIPDMYSVINTIMKTSWHRNAFGISGLSWWRHQIETFSALLAICAGNSPVTGEFSAQRPVTRSFEFSFGLRLNKRLSKQSWGWWFETYRTHYNITVMFCKGYQRPSQRESNAELS